MFSKIFNSIILIMILQRRTRYPLIMAAYELLPVHTRGVTGLCKFFLKKKR